MNEEEKIIQLNGFKDELLKEAGFMDKLKLVGRSLQGGFKGKAPMLKGNPTTTYGKTVNMAHTVGTHVGKNKKMYALGATGVAAGGAGYALGDASSDKTTVVYR